jgi:hypothetical protein
MTVIAMSRTEIDRMSVLRDLADGRIRAAEVSTLMDLGGVRCFGWRRRVASIDRRRWCQQRGRPSNRCYPSSRPLHSGCKH